jgi:hypothetical protein
MRNTPYQKQYNSNGECVNHITERKPFLNYSPNRSTRHEATKTKPHVGNGRGCPITVAGTFKYLRATQVIYLADGGVKRINHSILRNNI